TLSTAPIRLTRDRLASSTDDTGMRSTPKALAPVPRLTIEAKKTTVMSRMSVGVMGFIWVSRARSEQTNWDWIGLAWTRPAAENRMDIRSLLLRSLRLPAGDPTIRAGRTGYTARIRRNSVT